MFIVTLQLFMVLFTVLCMFIVTLPIVYVVVYSVAYVSRSGGMSNELNNIISRKSNGVYEGVAIGGDRYPGSTFIDHVLRFHDNPDVKMIVLLGEVRFFANFIVAF